MSTTTKLIVLAVMLVIIVVALLCVGYAVLLEHRRVLNNLDNGRAAKIDVDTFIIVAFPKPETDNLSLKRAVLLTLTEFRNDSVNVFIGNDSTTIDSAKLTAVTLPEREIAEIANLNRAIVAWGPQTDWSRIHVFVNRLGFEGETVVRLTVFSKKRNRFEYLYRVLANGDVVPVWSLTIRAP